MADASYPDELLYHEEHDWVRLDGETALFGITWFAQDALGEVVFFDPPEVGSTVTRGESYAEVESVKAVSDVIAPMSGEIVEVNTALGGSPEAMHTVMATAKYRRTRRDTRVVPNTGMTISIEATRNRGNMNDATQVLIWVSVSASSDCMA